MKSHFGTVGKDGFSLNWCESSKTVTIELNEHVNNSAFSPTYYLVLILVGHNDTNVSEYLYGYRITGELVFKVKEPEGYSFYYLASHIDHETAVVCVSKGHEPDWYFSISPRDGALEPLNRAY